MDTLLETPLGEAVIHGPFGTPAVTMFTQEDRDEVAWQQDFEEEPLLRLDAA